MFKSLTLMYIYRLKDENLIINAFDLETELIAADAVNISPKTNPLQPLWLCFDRETYTVEREERPELLVCL